MCASVCATFFLSQNVFLFCIASEWFYLYLCLWVIHICYKYLTIIYWWLSTILNALNKKKALDLSNGEREKKKSVWRFLCDNRVSKMNSMLGSRYKRFFFVHSVCVFLEAKGSIWPDRGFHKNQTAHFLSKSQFFYAIAETPTKTKNADGFFHNYNSFISCNWTEEIRKAQRTINWQRTIQLANIGWAIQKKKTSLTDSKKKKKKKKNGEQHPDAV